MLGVEEMGSTTEPTTNEYMKKSFGFVIDFISIQFYAKLGQKIFLSVPTSQPDLAITS